MSSITNNRMSRLSGMSNRERQTGIQRGQTAGLGRRPNPTVPDAKHGTTPKKINAAIELKLMDRHKVSQELTTAFPTGQFADSNLRRVTKDMMKEIHKRNHGDAQVATRSAEQIVKMGPEEFQDWQKSGIGLQDWHVFKDVAQEQGFIFVRKVNHLSTGLIESGFGTKKLDIHSKSADWGPQAGFIPVDQSLSKKVGDPEAVSKGSDQAKESLTKPHIGATQLHLPMSRVVELIEREILPQTVLTGEPNQPRLNGDGEFIAAKEGHQMAFKLEQGGDQMLAVSYKPQGATDWLPLEVLGYVQDEHVQKDLSPKNKAKVTTPVTADYDLFATCPHHADLADRKNEYATHDGIQPKGQLGYLSTHDIETMDKLNQGMGGLPKVNHGPDTGNPVPEIEDEYVMFTPSGNGRMVKAEDMPQIFDDIHSGGHITPHNKKWVKTPEQRDEIKEKATVEMQERASKREQALKSIGLKKHPKSDKYDTPHPDSKRVPKELVYHQIGFKEKTHLHGLQLKVLRNEDFSTNTNKKKISSYFHKNQTLRPFHRSQSRKIADSRPERKSSELPLKEHLHERSSFSGDSTLTNADRNPSPT